MLDTLGRATVVGDIGNPQTVAGQAAHWFFSTPPWVPTLLAAAVTAVWLFYMIRLDIGGNASATRALPPAKRKAFFKGRGTKAAASLPLHEALHLCRVEVRFSDLHSGQFEVEFYAFNGSDLDIAFSAVKGSVKFFGVIGGEGKRLETLQPSGGMSGFDAVVRPMEECRVVVSQSLNKPSLEAVKQGFAASQGFWLKLDGLQLLFAPVSTPDRREALTIWPSIECYQSVFGVHVTKYIPKSGTFVLPDATAQFRS